VREAIASAIEARGGFEGTRVLDLYAGTGAMAIEALSRGAVHATLVEADRSAARAIVASLAELGLGDRAVVVTRDLSSSSVIDALTGPFDRVLADPPYADAARVPALLDALADAQCLSADAIVVVEHPSRVALTLGPRFPSITEKRYGDTSVHLARFTP